jgi:hypothetical protein
MNNTSLWLNQLIKTPGATAVYEWTYMYWLNHQEPQQCMIEPILCSLYGMCCDTLAVPSDEHTPLR